MIVDKIKTHKDNIYLNVVISPILEFGADDSPAVYNETLTIPVLQNPSEYYCSIIRFSLPLETIPLLKFPLDVKQNNPLVSYLVIGVETAALVQFPENVIYDPPNNRTPPTPLPTSPFFTNQQSIDGFYNIFSIRTFLTMINRALAAASLAAVGAGVTSPYYSYDSTKELFSLNVHSSFLATNAKIFLNRYLINYLNSFPWYLDITTGDQDFLFFHILDPIPLPPIINNFSIYVQDYVSISSWFDLRKITVTSTTLPITPESVPVQNPTLGGKSNGLTSYSPILTDYLVAFDTTRSVQSTAVYNPSAQYRLVDMSSSAPLQRINLAFYYHDKFGNQYPIALSPSQEITVKIGFFRRSLYDNDLY